MVVIEIKTKDEFDNYISQGKLILVDFYAVWCGPCKMISPKVEALSNDAEYSGVVFLKVDVDNGNLQKLSQDYEISAMPTFIFFKDASGNSKDKLVSPTP
ncbi:9676_t:CDS:2 [Funneliformis geosporum]|uniref:9676_t:CDS:1 n=1 Tax=Funneliformis geosporum TaxID=1117311 RepID=A0A9W4WZU4_9GLOM|nr:9676_t:CDS:2 [Funneliformis geosporum]